RIADAALHILDEYILAKFPFRLKPTLGLVGSSAGSERPHHLLVLVPVRRYHHSQNESLPSGVEMGRLAAIAERLAFQSNGVVGPDRDIDLFLIIAVEIPEDHVVGPIGILFPAFKYGSDVLAPGILDLSAHTNGGTKKNEGSQPHGLLPSVRGGFFRFS